MAACPEHDESLTLLAAGALEPEDEARVRAHLTSCAGCRAEVEAQHEVLGLCALAPPSAREQAVLAALPRTTVSAWRRGQVQQAARMRTAGALMAAAAVVLLTLGPAVLRRVAPRPPTPSVETSVQAAEDAFELEQWALADPLGDLLDGDLDDPDTGLESEDPESDDFLFTYPGDAL